MGAWIEFASYDSVRGMYALHSHELFMRYRTEVRKKLSPDLKRENQFLSKEIRESIRVISR
jgi:hypothetical protein